MQFMIHMGNYKTGSTALQSYLYQNAERLAEHHIYYGNTDPAPLCSHASFTYSLLRLTLQNMGLFDTYQSHPMYQYIPQTPEQILAQIVKEAVAKHCETILLSHEALFCEAWRTLNGLRRIPNLGPFSESDILQCFHQNLFHLLSIHAQKIQVIIYLRRQDEYLESQYNQYIKAPWWEEELELPDFSEFLSLHPVTLDYTKPLKSLKKIYGSDHLTVLSYTKKHAVHDDFVTQVLEIPSHLRHEWKLPEISMANRSISHDVIDFKCHFLSPDAAFHPNVQNWLTEYSTLHPDDRDYTYLTPETYESLRKQYEEINHEINVLYMKKNNCIPAFDSLRHKIFYPGITPENLQNLVYFFSSHPY